MEMEDVRIVSSPVISFYETLLLLLYFGKEKNIIIIYDNEK